MKKIFLFVVLLLIFCISFSVRIKDISIFSGARDNQLFGVGVVTGLNNTGDSGSVSSELIINIMKNLGIELNSSIKSKNTAIVMVTADIPPYYKSGMKIDIVVSALGDSKSIENGTLIQTPLYGADKNVYAVAQGNVLTGGADVKSSPNLQKKNKVNGFIPKGAIVEREIPVNIINDNSVTLNLKTPDITTSSRISMAINNSFSDRISKAIDPSSVRVFIPDLFIDDTISFLSLIEEIEVQPDTKAKIVINEKTGTIVLGGKVRISDFTLSYGNFVVSVKNQKINSEEATIDNVISALKTAGATPQDIIAIIQNISTAGYIYADVVVM